MNRFIQTVLNVTASIWAFARDVGTVLQPCRFSAFVVLAGGGLVLAIPQGQELTVRLADEGTGKVLLFYACVFVWAFQSWYWARLMLEATFGPDRTLSNLRHPRLARIRWLINQVPRAVAALAYASATAACLLSGEALKIGLGLAVQGVAFYWLVVRRRTWVAHLEGQFPEPIQKLLRRADSTEGLSNLAPLSRWILYASIISAVMLAGWVCLGPVAFGWFFGSAGVVFVGLSMIVPVGSLLVYVTRYGGTRRTGELPENVAATGRGYPVVTTLLLIAIVFSVWVDNHSVRQLRSRSSGRVEVAKAVDQWSGQASRNAGQPTNLVIVATAGGGIRAAYWTATVLGAIQDRAPEFRRQLLAISGVSGGSLGAAVFVTLLAQPKLPDKYLHCQAKRASSGQPSPLGPYECAGQKVLSQDFLAPAAAAALFPDLIQRFWPFSWFPDRAQALERGWEQAWPRAGFAANIWSDSRFEGLWPTTGHLPALLLNGTHVDTGKRVITSNLLIKAREFADAYDFFDLLPASSQGPASIRPSTAALNSARFTYVSPAGTVGEKGRIVDGGYFENFGAVTAGELLNAALSQLRKPDAVLRPIVIVISNDPKLNKADFPTTSEIGALPYAGSAPLKKESWAGEILSPIRALLATRDARGILAVHDLAGIATVDKSATAPQGAVEGKFFHFRLCPDNAGAKDPALGWVLSRESEELMRSQLYTNACRNDTQLGALVGLLTGR